uniref:(northern house mosquito) hypothetical protein n=1 Tax=Culex pipiens TaxID=7175 RepID=A0A8D8BJN7_CULPI
MPYVTIRQLPASKLVLYSHATLQIAFSFQKQSLSQISCDFFIPRSSKMAAAAVTTDQPAEKSIVVPPRVSSQSQSAGKTTRILGGHSQEMAERKISSEKVLAS